MESATGKTLNMILRCTIIFVRWAIYSRQDKLEGPITINL